MTVNELILLDKAKVRRDSNLMHLYLEFFKEAFGRVPNCAGCSFGTDWQKLVSLYSKKSVTLQKVNPMKTIQIKKIQGKILTYKKGGRTYRQYDNILTDEFIKEFIVSGTEEENKERVKMFNFPVEEKSFEEIAEDNVSKKETVDFTKESEIASKIIEKSKRGRKSKK